MHTKFTHSRQADNITSLTTEVQVQLYKSRSEAHSPTEKCTLCKPINKMHSRAARGIT